MALSYVDLTSRSPNTRLMKASVLLPTQCTMLKKFIASNKLRLIVLTLLSLCTL